MWAAPRGEGRMDGLLKKERRASSPCREVAECAALLRGPLEITDKYGEYHLKWFQARREAARTAVELSRKCEVARAGLLAFGLVQNPLGMLP